MLFLFFFSFFCAISPQRLNGGMQSTPRNNAHRGGEGKKHEISRSRLKVTCPNLPAQPRLMCLRNRVKNQVEPSDRQTLLVLIDGVVKGQHKATPLCAVPVLAKPCAFEARAKILYSRKRGRIVKKYFAQLDVSLSRVPVYSADNALFEIKLISPPKAPRALAKWTARRYLWK